MLTRDLLQTRLLRVQAEKARQQAIVRELERQINALIGREAELTELIALLDAPPQEPV